MSFSNWTKTTWGEITELKYGKGLKGYKENTEGVPVFGTNGKIGYTEKPLANGPGVIIGRKGAYRGVHFSNTDFYVIDTAYYLEPLNENIDIEWAYYELLTKDINSLDSGSAIPSTKREDFYALPVKVPPLSIQKTIAKSLRRFDEKIALNKEIIKNLEQLGQTLFNRWFIDFDFPYEDGKSYVSSNGEMVENEIGLIPKGWKVTTLDNIANYENGLAMQKFRPIDEEKSLPVLKIKELNQGFTDENSDRCRDDIKESVQVYDGDIIFSWSGTLLVKVWVGGRAGLNQHLFKVTSEKYEKWFYYYWTRFHLNKFIQIAADKATTMGHIKRSHLTESFVVVPPQQTLEKFNKMMKPILDKIIQTGLESEKIFQLRNTLLPKLLSGEIEISLESEEEVHVQV